MTHAHDPHEPDARRHAKGTRPSDAGRGHGMRPPHHHNAPPGSSDLAADRIAARTPTLRQLVYAQLAAAGTRGLTDQEGAALLKLAGDTYRPRRRELVKLGSVIATAHRRPTHSGALATVWIARGWQSGQAGDAPAGVSATRWAFCRL